MNDLYSSIFIKSCFIYDINNFLEGFRAEAGGCTK